MNTEKQNEFRKLVQEVGELPAGVMACQNDVTENEIEAELKKAGYDYSVAIATQAEIDAGAACGQLSIIVNED